MQPMTIHLVELLWLISYLALCPFSLSAMSENHHLKITLLPSYQRLSQHCFGHPAFAVCIFFSRSFFQRASGYFWISQGEQNIKTWSLNIKTTLSLHHHKTSGAQAQPPTCPFALPDFTIKIGNTRTLIVVFFREVILKKLCGYALALIWVWVMPYLVQHQNQEIFILFIN